MKGKKTGGRRKGSLNLRTRAMSRDLYAELLSGGIAPLGHMLKVMRMPLPKRKKGEELPAFHARLAAHLARQDAMAIAALPYCHPKFGPLEPLPLPKLSDNQPASGENVVPFRDFVPKSEGGNGLDD